MPDTMDEALEIIHGKTGIPNPRWPIHFLFWDQERRPSRALGVTRAAFRTIREPKTNISSKLDRNTWWLAEWLRLGRLFEHGLVEVPCLEVLRQWVPMIS